jgi:hypothetical protein
MRRTGDGRVNKAISVEEGGGGVQSANDKGEILPDRGGADEI